jgi:hypothetical protein
MGVWFRLMHLCLMHIKGFSIYTQGVYLIFRVEIRAFDASVLSNLYLD